MCKSPYAAQHYISEEVTNFEFDLMARVTCSTWENISELIGMSSTMLDRCIKILDHSDNREVDGNIGNVSRKTNSFV